MAQQASGGKVGPRDKVAPIERCLEKGHNLQCPIKVFKEVVFQLNWPQTLGKHPIVMTARSSPYVPIQHVS